MIRMDITERDRLAYKLALEFILGLRVSGVTSELLDKYLHPDPVPQETHDLGELYKRLLESAQNANMRSGVIGKAIGGFANLAPLRGSGEIALRLPHSSDFARAPRPSPAGRPFLLAHASGAFPVLPYFEAKCLKQGASRRGARYCLDSLPPQVANQKSEELPNRTSVVSTRRDCQNEVGDSSNNTLWGES